MCPGMAMSPCLTMAQATIPQHAARRRNAAGTVLAVLRMSRKSQVLAARDPTRRGLPSKLALRLLRSLLAWNPVARPRASDALRHAYFTVELDKQAQHVCAATNERSERSQFPLGWC